ncbi:hypothetical protein BB559_005208 [Furculomyces boomerangus]|uniref:MICOS complex subunit MIC60 n=2 Tax=Harpellales TaxID=61421 RepID=A0A2T9YA40_9FUNG|nr:hypothetical protein BB559_005208 [Furculomyces boomerangus]PVZ98412.1 hypothetical protein BB558_005581 [Smittium angustum]
MFRAVISKNLFKNRSCLPQTSFNLIRKSNFSVSPLMLKDELSPKAAESEPKSPESAKTAEQDSKTSGATKKSSKKWILFKLSSNLGILLGLTIVGGGFFYTKVDQENEYAKLYKDYVPFANSFLAVMERNNNSVTKSLGEIGSTVSEDVSYSANFIVEHFNHLLSMIKNNTWTSEKKPLETNEPDILKTVKSVNSAKKALVEKPDTQEQKNVSAPVNPVDEELLAFSNPISSIQFGVEIPTIESIEPLVTELSYRVGNLVKILNSLNLSPKYLAEMRDISEVIIAIDSRFYDIDGEKRVEVENAIEQVKKQAEAAMEIAQNSFDEKVKEIHNETKDIVDIAIAKTQLEDLEILNDKLIELEIKLTQRFDRIVQARVDEERDGRLARLDKVEKQFVELAASSENLIGYVELTRKANKFVVAANALRTAVENSSVTSTMSTPQSGHCSPFLYELGLVKQACSQELYPATFLALKSPTLEQASQEGVCTIPMLEDRFDYLRKEIKRVSLVPEDSNLFSHVSSLVLSKVMFNKHGLVEGKDVDAVLARTSFYLKENNLDLATRELNQLSGWPKALAEDWLTAARRRLEVEQLFQVMDAEQIMYRLKNL